MDYKERLKKIRGYLDEKNLSALIVRDRSNIFYLTGLLEIEGLLLVSKNKLAFFAPALYYRESIDTAGCKINTLLYKKENLNRHLVQYNRIAFINTEFTYAAFTNLKRQFKINAVPVPDFIKEMRMVKSPGEISLIKKSLSINKKVFREIEKKLRPGHTEREIEGELHCLIRRFGGRKEGFTPIVASGANAAYPHHKSGGKKITARQPVIIDSGVDFSGYKSDLTETFFIGGPDNEFSELYNIVREVLEKTKDFIKPGISGKDVHNYASCLLKKRRLDKYFVHGLGHGIGIDVHEKPVLNPASEDILQEGCIFTVEPGIYLPGRGGIRLESMVFL